MNKKLVITFLILLFLFSLGIRLYFVSQTPHFNLGDSYFTERQVTSIIETGFPTYVDGLSFSGKTQVFMPLFYYILALFNLVIPFWLVGKIIPNIFAASIVFFSFMLAKRITRNNIAALLTAFISAFIPIFFIQTLNNISPYSLIMPLMLYQLYCFIEKKFTCFAILAVLLPLIHFSAVVLPISLVVFVIISKVEHFKVKKPYAEMIIFSLVLSLWLLLVFYKQAFFFHGLEILSKNMPFSVIGQHFAEVNLVEAIYLTGIIPFIYGMISLYKFLFKKRFFEGFLMISLVITPAFLLWMTLIEVTQGILFLGVFVTILFSSHYNSIKSFIKKSKFSHLKYYKHYFIASSILIFVLTSVLPSFFLAGALIETSLSEDEFQAMSWIKTNTEKDAIILAQLEEGNAIASIAKRKNVIDNNFLLIRNINVRNKEFEKMFSSPYKTETISLMNKYQVSHVYISKRKKVNVFTDKFKSNCFKEVFSNNEVNIFEVKCEIRT